LDEAFGDDAATIAVAGSAQGHDLSSIAEGLVVSVGLGVLVRQICAISEQGSALAGWAREIGFRVSYVHERKNTEERCGVAVEVG
jgi:hypothetical protein